jgi:hypothetical protein
MMIFPNATTASWNDTTITVVCSPKIGTEYILPYEYSGTWTNITVHVNNLTGDKINVTVTNEQNAEPTYYELTRNLTFNRTFVLPRIYKDIPSMYISYFYGEDIQKAGYSIEPLAGETLLFEVTVEKVYKTSQGTN